MSTAWLFLGDIAQRASKVKINASDLDIILLAPPHPMFKPICTYCGQTKVKVDVLGQEVLTQTDLENATDKIEQVINIIKSIKPDTDLLKKPWWLFRATYLTSALRENALGSIALKNWLSKRKPKKVIIVRESAKLTTIDFLWPGKSGPDNVMSFVAEKLCNELRLDYDIFYIKNHKWIFKRYLLSLFSYLSPYVRIFFLLLRAVLCNKKYDNGSKRNGVIFFSRSHRYNTLLEDLIKKCPIELNPLVLYQQTLDREKIKFKLDFSSVPLESYSTLKKIFKGIKTTDHVSNDTKIIDDPIAPGFINEYLKHVTGHAIVLSPYYQTLIDALQDLQPRLIIATDESGPFNQLIFDVAQANLIPTVSIQHGEVSAAEVVLMHIPKTGDLQLVRPGGFREFCITKGLDGRKMVEYFKTTILDDCCKSNSIMDSHVVFIAGTSLGVNAFIPVLHETIDMLIATIADIHIKFRPHPFESVNEYQLQLSKYCHKVEVVSPTGSLKDQLKDVTCSLVFSSSIAMDIALSGTPTVVYTFNRWPLLGYNENFFDVVYNIQDAVNAVFHNLTEEGQIQCIKKIKLLRENFLLATKSPAFTDWWEYIGNKFKLIN